jgi:hypothetical protein
MPSGLGSTHGVNPTPGLVSDLLNTKGMVPLPPDSHDTLLDSSMTLDADASFSDSKDKDDLIVETLAKVAKQKGFNTHEAGFLLHVLDVEYEKRFDYPGFESGRFFLGSQTDLEGKRKKRFDAEIILAEAKSAEDYGDKRNWSLGKAELNDSLDFIRKTAIILLWARGFAAGIYANNFNTTTAEVVLRDKPTDLIPSMYRDKFLELYGPKSPDPMEVILSSKIDTGDGGDDEGFPLGVIVVLLLALAALVYLTRR